MVKRSAITGKAGQGWGGGVGHRLARACVCAAGARDGKMCAPLDNPPGPAVRGLVRGLSLSLPIDPSIPLGGACMVRPWKVCLTVSANRLGLSASIAAACPAASRGAAE